MVDLSAIASKPVPMEWISLNVSRNTFQGTIVLKFEVKKMFSVIGKQSLMTSDSLIK
jgi:hypothetical protein